MWGSLCPDWGSPLEQRDRLDLGAFPAEKPPCQVHEPKVFVGAIRYHLGDTAELFISCVSCHWRELSTYNPSSGQQHMRCPGHRQEASKPSSAAHSWVIAEREFCAVNKWLLEALTPVLSAPFCSWAAGEITCLWISLPSRGSEECVCSIIKILQGFGFASSWGHHKMPAYWLLLHSCHPGEKRGEKKYIYINQYIKGVGLCWIFRSLSWFFINKASFAWRHFLKCWFIGNFQLYR